MKLSKTLIAASFAVAATVSTVASAVQTLSFTGYYNRLVVDPSNGDVYAAGDCTRGDCGPGVTTYFNPNLTFSGMTNIKSVTSNMLRSFFLTRNGNVYTVGNRNATPRKIEFHNEVIDMASIGLGVGRRHYFIVREGGYTVDGRTFPMGSLWLWDEAVSSTPVKVGERNDYIMISGGDSNVGVLNKNGDLWSWGYRQIAYGEGSNDVSIRRYAPKIEPSVSGHQFRYISVGSDHMLAIDMQDRVWSWGSDKDGKLCNGTTQGVGDLRPALNGVVNAKTATASRNASIILTNDNTLSTCGWHNLIYQGTSYNRDQDAKTIDFASATPAFLSHGPNGTYTFQDTVGNAWTWGQDTAGKLGNGTGNPAGDDVETHRVGATKRIKTVGAVVLEGDVAWEPLVVEEAIVSREIGKEKCNASANNGKGGNYEKTGMCDNGKGNGVGRMQATERTAFTMRNDGRGFQRSKK